MAVQDVANSGSTFSEHATGGVWKAFAQSGWLWGTAVAVVFYLILPSLPLDPTFKYRYFESHWIEYATVWLFTVGMATLFFSGIQVPHERSALAEDLIDGLYPQSGESALDMVSRIESQLRLTAKRFSQSHVARRLWDACRYVRGRRSADGLESHLGYLADQAAGRLHSNYALVRTITWAIPILGFLGTVIGITMAIANVTPEQLESSLNEVTAGLAVAFDTTALSLALSMVLVFCTFVVERSEGSILDRVEDFGVQRLLACFPLQEQDKSPWVEAEMRAAETLLAKSAELITAQTQVWNESLVALREGWLETISAQQKHLAQSLEGGTAAALNSHSEQLAEFRREFTKAYETVSERLMEQLAESQWAIKEETQAARVEIAATWNQFRAELESSHSQVSAEGERILHEVVLATSSWQDQLQSVVEGVSEQARSLDRHTLRLAELSQNEQQLLHLEDRLANSLDSAKVAQNLEHTVLNLNAAVNLLTARQMGKAA